MKMKKYISIILLTLLAGLISSCKKDATPKDYSASIKDKTWWGTLSYTGKALEYYSVHFNADGSLSWSQQSGDYPGSWIVNDKQLTMTFPGISSEIKAYISDDDKLMTITDNNASFTINSGELFATPIQSLDNTVWKGSRIINVPNTPIKPQSFQMSFTAGSDVRIQFTSGNTTTTTKYNYTKLVSGAVRATSSYSTNIYFGVIAADNEMKGTIDNSNNTWQVTKQ